MSSYENTVWLVGPVRGAPVSLSCSKHHELQSISRFGYLKIRDFLIPGCKLRLANVYSASRTR
jgi:hypothetical protein